MLKVQEYLSKKNNSLVTLNEELAISSKVNEDDGRIILNYSQIDSPKFNPVVRECRGLVLDQDYNLVARAFNRFFNVGEHVEEQKKFVWEDSIAYDKEDGTLIICYYWNNRWNINTRNTFGDGTVGGVEGLTWTSWFNDIMCKYNSDWRSSLDNQYTYVFELCSRLNKIVRDYKEPKLFLLTTFFQDLESTHECTNSLAKLAKVDSPIVRSFSDVYDVTNYLAEQAQDDATYEGVVIRDIHNKRLKAKSQSYVHLHHIAGNGAIGTPKRILPFILKGEEAEVICYFPEIEEYVMKIKTKVDKVLQEVDNIWFCHHDQKNRKKFASAVKHHPLSAMLFTAKDRNCNPLELVEEEKFQQLILKKVFPKSYED